MHHPALSSQPPAADSRAGPSRGNDAGYELPRIGALNFVLAGAVTGGVTRSLALDAPGKGLGSALFALEIPDLEVPDQP